MGTLKAAFAGVLVAAAQHTARRLDRHIAANDRRERMPAERADDGQRNGPSGARSESRSRRAILGECGDGHVRRHR